MRNMPDGPINVDHPYLRNPAKPDVYKRMEEMIAHFKMVIDGLKPPVGEVYFPTEAANGELGFYIVSDGSGKPYKCLSLINISEPTRLRRISNAVFCLKKKILCMLIQLLLNYFTIINIYPIMITVYYAKMSILQQ